MTDLDGVMTLSTLIPCPQCGYARAVQVSRDNGIRSEITHIYCDECGLRRNVEDETTLLLKQQLLQ